MLQKADGVDMMFFIWIDDGRRIGVFFRLTSVIGVVKSPTKATKADERTFVAGSLGKYADETRVSADI